MHILLCPLARLLPVAKVLQVANAGRLAKAGAAAAASLMLGFLAAPATASEVNLYTTREPGLIKPLLDAYTAKTGTKINTIFVSAGLSERVAAEGERSPADVMMTVDYGNLIDLVDKGLTQPVKSAVLEGAIPANLRDKDGQWFSLSMRARIVYLAKDVPGLPESMTYEDLSDPKWKGRICIRSGQHPYNTSLIGAMIAKDGAEKTADWVKGVKDNLARKATGGDREGARDILAGICDVAVGNSYYVGLMRSGKGGEEQKRWGEAIRVIFPTFADRAGTHVNVSGAALAKHAPHREEGVKFLEWLVSDEAQQLYSHANYEYPVKAGIAADPIIAALGTLTVDPLPLLAIGEQRKEASLIVDRVGFDE